jgi:phage/conjugal plasmid C-4 type zinc finger TraR family protein
MTDIFDRAGEQEERDRKNALQAQMNRADLDGKTVADSATHCGDCGDEIPHKRREAAFGCKFCIDCQGQREKAFYEH